MSEADAVLAFWKDAGPKMWFTRDDGFDRDILLRFGALHQKAAAGELADWQNAADSALALILVLDQFSRNLFRDNARSFAQDGQGLRVAKSCLSKGFDHQVDSSLKQFFYMPLMHSESILDQQACIGLFHATGMAENLKYAILHRDIIARFGRFPHRNKVLGRATSSAEQVYLDEGGFSG